MMKCKSCYQPSESDFCLSCRKKLFDKKRISSKLDFDPFTLNHDVSVTELSKELFVKRLLCLKKKNLEIITDDDSCSLSYIVKSRPIRNLQWFSEDMPENEHLTMQIAEQVFGIETAANALMHTSNDKPAYLSRRFDFVDGKKVYSEDFEQLSERVVKIVGNDFQFEGNYEELAKLIKKYVSAYIPALEEFFKIVIFNYLFSNSNATFKDFSIIKIENGECKLAPAYNLLNMQLHSDQYTQKRLKLYKDVHLSSLLSMQGYLVQTHFFEFADRIGIMKKRALRILAQFQSSEKQVIELVHLSFLQHAAKGKYIDMFREKLMRIQE